MRTVELLPATLHAREAPRQRRRAPTISSNIELCRLPLAGRRFLLESLLGGLAIVDIGTRDIPADHLTLVIANRVGNAPETSGNSVALRSRSSSS